MSISSEHHFHNDAPIKPSAIFSPEEAAKFNAVRKTLVDEAYHTGIGNYANTDDPSIVREEVKDAKAIATTGALLGTLTADTLARQLNADLGKSALGAGHTVISGKVVEPHIERSVRDIDPSELGKYTPYMKVTSIGMSGVDKTGNEQEQQRYLIEMAAKAEEERRKAMELARKMQEAQLQDKSSLLERVVSVFIP